MKKKIKADFISVSLLLITATKKGYLLIYLLTCGMDLVRICFHSNPGVFFLLEYAYFKRMFIQKNLEVCTY